MENREFKKLLEVRTLKFAIEIVNFCILLRKLNIPDALTTQLLKSGTSIGSNYREANRAESKKDFIHKIGISEKESSETVYWLEVLDGSRLTDKTGMEIIANLHSEANELLAIFNSISRRSKDLC